MRPAAALLAVVGVLAGRSLALKSRTLALEHAFRSQLAAGEEARILMTGDQEEIAKELQPWLQPDAPHAPEGKGYLTFESDSGGFNNIRMAFEYFVDVARTSGRTLVLPPQEAIYLLDWGPKTYKNKTDAHWMPIRTVTEYGDLWEIPDLQRKIPVISAQEFYERERDRMGIPWQAEPNRQRNPQVDFSPWKQWITSSGKALLASSGSLVRGCDAVRRIAETSADEAPLVHIPERLFEPSDGARNPAVRAGTEQRFLYCSSEMVHDLHYRSHLFQLASGPVAEMGARQYVAVHLRRNDFQYRQAPDQGDELLRRLQPMLLPNETVYVASDEVDEQWWASLREAMASQGHQVRAFKEFLPELERRGLIEKFTGLVEMIVCSGARRFFGSPSSTFTQGIQLLREELKKSGGGWGANVTFSARREMAFLQK